MAVQDTSWQVEPDTSWQVEPAEEPVQRPGMWSRVGTLLSASRIALEAGNRGRHRLSEERAERDDQANLERQQRRAPFRRSYSDFVQDGALDDLPFPASSGIDPATFAANARYSAEVEAEDAEGDLEQAEAIVRGEREGVTMEPVASALNGFGQRATDILEAGMNAGAMAESAIRRRAPSETGMRWLAEQTDKWQQAMMPVDRVRQEQGELGQAIAEGAGSTLPVLVGGVAGAGTKGMAGIGMTLQASAGLDEAIAHEATGTQQWVSYLVNAGLGATEAIPLARGINRAERLVPGRFDWSALWKQGGAEAIEEAMQEAFQTTGSNAVAIATYDPERHLFEGVGQSMLVGGIVGGGLGTVQAGGAQIVDVPMRQVSDDDLVGAIIQGEAEQSAAWQAMEQTNVPLAERMAQLDDHTANLERHRREAERRGLEIPEPRMEPREEVSEEIAPQIDRIVGQVATELTASGQGEAEIAASTAIFRAKLEVLAAKDPEAVGARLQDLNLRIQSAEPTQADGELFAQTPEFQNWFGDSQVVEGGGEPLTVYHGTGNLAGLEQFDPGLTGQGNDQYGSGFYFTTSPSVAGGYATAVTPNVNPGTEKLGGDTSPGVLPVHLSLQNPIKVTSETRNLTDVGLDLSPQQVRQMLNHAEAVKRPPDSDEMNPLGDHFEGFWEEGPQDWMLDSVAETYAGDQVEAIEVELFDGDSEAFRKALSEATGYDGVEITFPETGEKHYVAWFPEQIKSVFNRGTYDPANPDILQQENRASITLPQGGVLSGDQTLIKLGAQSDASSFMHEAAHLFLEMYKDLSADSVVIGQEFAEIKDWLGVEGDQISRAQHEKFAEGFEAYLARGVAPTPGLASAFRSFKRWLSQIYNALKGSDQLSLDPQGVKIFDRMLTMPTPDRVLGRVRKERRLPNGQGVATAPGERVRMPVPADQGVDSEGESLRELSRDLGELLGLNVKEGRLVSRGAEGEMHPSGEIRVRMGEDFTTLVHEAGHLLAARHPEAFQKVVQAARIELIGLTSGIHTPKGMAADEGFAELVRIYIESPNHLLTNAPTAASAFVKEFTAVAPEVIAGLKELSDRYNTYMLQSSERAVSGHIVSSANPSGLRGIFSRLNSLRNEFDIETTPKDLFDGFYSYWIDGTNPIRRVQSELVALWERTHGRKMPLKPSKDAARLARLAADGYQAGTVDLQNGVVPFQSLKPEGPSLAEALALALGNKSVAAWSQNGFEDFGSYLASRRIVEEYRRKERGLLSRNPDLFSMAEHLQNIADKEAMYPDIRAAADMVNEWGRNLLKKKLDAGLITQDQFNRFTETRDFYVPLLRDVRSSNASAGQTSSSRKNKDNGVTRFRGSNRAIINPLESMIRDAHQTSMAIWRNETIGALYDMAMTAGLGSGDYLVEVPAHEMSIDRQDAKAIFARAAEQAGVDEQDAALVVAAMDDTLDGQTMAIIYGMKEAQERGEQIIYLWRNGERKMLRINDDPRGKMLFNALTGLGRQHHHWLIEAMGLPTKLLTQSITGYPVFPAVNWLRDQLQTATLSPTGFIPYKDGLQGVAALMDKDLVSEYQVAGGHMGGINASIAERVRRTVDMNELRPNPFFRELLSWNGVSTAFDVAESSTRIRHYELLKKQAMRGGLSEYEAALYATFGSRDTMDYKQRGAGVLAYIAGRLVPFFRPALNGTTKAFRTAFGGRAMSELPRIMRPLFSGRLENLTTQEKADLKAFLHFWPYLAAMAAFSAMLANIHMDNPDWWEIDDRMRATHWHLYQDEGGLWVRFVKPFELAAPANLVERYLMEQYANDPTQMSRGIEGLQYVFLPPTEIPALNVPAEIRANEDFDRGRPIVPQHMEGLPPPLQVAENTSAIAQWVGSVTNTSPMMIDHTLFSLTGTMGSDFRRMSDAMDPDAPAMTLADFAVQGRFLDDPETGSQSVADFWDQVGQRGGALSSAQQAYRALALDEGSDIERAIGFFRDQDSITQEWMALNTHAASSMREFVGIRQEDRNAHPIRRAERIMRVNSDLRSQLNENRLRAPRSDEVIEMSRTQRRHAKDALAALNVWEADNALRQTGFDGRAGRPQKDYELLMDTLEAVSPEVAEIYRLRMYNAVGGGLMDPDVAADRWIQVRDRLDGMFEGEDGVRWLRGAIERRRLAERMAER